MNVVARKLAVAGSMWLLFWVGCGDDEDTSGSQAPSATATAGPTSTGTMGNTSSMSSTQSSTTGAGASGPGCDDVPTTAPSNGACVVLTGGGGSGGGVGGGGTTVTAGQGGAGGGAAVPLFACNPITSEPCDTAAGEACDYSGESAAFVCFPSGNTEGSCEMCNNVNGPWCQPGFTCYSGRDKCRRYCCDDGDCGPTLTCKKDIQTFIDAGAPQVGVCY